MRNFRFFATRIFLRKPILAIALLLLVLMLNYVSFSTIRTVVSTAEGRQQVEHVNTPGTYISNIDPDSDVDFENLTEESVQGIYTYLADNYQYSFHVDGMIATIPNRHGLEIPVSYMNERFVNLDGFPVASGAQLRFDYSIAGNESIPVLIGHGLAADYPLGSKLVVEDSALGREVVFQVAGILEKDASRSNYYAYDSKQYYNFAIVAPVTEEFISLANIDLKLNGLNDLIIMSADEASLSKLEQRFRDATGAEFNFYSHQENQEYYFEYYYSSMVFLSIITLILVALIASVTVWSSLVSVNLMMPDFTINLLVGLSYRRLKRMFLLYFAVVFAIVLIALYAFIVYSRLSFWGRGDASFITFGFAGLIEMDWIALLATAGLDIVLITTIVSVVIWRIKRVPISMGVLQ